MNSKITSRILFLLALFALLGYSNYPSAKKFLFSNAEKISQLIGGKATEASNLIFPLQGIHLFLPEVEKNRIRVVMDATAIFPLENVAIQKVLKGQFEFLKEKQGNYLLWKKVSPDLFLSDFAKDLNLLATNVKKIKSIQPTENGEQLLFHMDAGKRLAIESPPINSLFDKKSYEWVYDGQKNLYSAYLADAANILNLGLDLKGGVYLDIGLDAERSNLDYLTGKMNGIIQKLKSLGTPIEDATSHAGSIVLSFPQNTTVDWNKEDVKALLDGLDRSTSGNKTTFTLSSSLKKTMEQESLSQVMGVIRSRIDQMGVKEPTIQKRGTSSVVVQIPGQNDAARIKALLTQPANLEFRLLTKDQTKSSETTLLDYETKDPVTKEILKSEQVAVSSQIAMKGNLVSDARVVFDQFSGSPQISMTLTAEGANTFGSITAENVGQSLAIILDGKIQSMPRINQAIYGGQASITGQFSVEEARDLAIILRSGSLPVSLVVNEERVMGATLGGDAIKKSISSLLVGFGILGLFVAVYYALSGIFAILTLLVNFFLILGILAFFGATLTLPGIAGIILTIGMAIDANVLVFERIREELNAGSSPRKAIEQGFNRVAVTILDANITTLFIALVLFQLGTGPVRGFAVTLAIGIFTTVLTSLVFTRILFELKYLFKANLKKISI